MLTWWYTIGWLDLLRRSADRLSSVLSYFSVSQLVGSLFAPFRQISAGGARGPLNVRMRAWGDKQFSRVIGAIVRLILIITGLVAFAATLAVCLLALLIWPILPVVPLFALIYMRWLQ